MTEALNVMLAAMVAELHRQAREGGPFLEPGPYVDDGVSEVDPTPDFKSVRIDGRVDLLEVARAGLEAIKDPGHHAHMVGLKDRNEFGSVCNTWAAMIEAVLGEGQPRP